MQERNDIMSVDAMMDERYGKVGWEHQSARHSVRRLMPIAWGRLSVMLVSARRSPNRNWLSVWEPISRISLA